MRHRWVAAVVLLAASTGCFSARTVTVRADAGSAHLAPGEALRVELGAVNSSIGDAWFLTTPPDGAVLRDRGRLYRGDCDAPGCGGKLTWEFTAAGKGTTTVVFRYCYRSTVDRCDTGPGRGPAAPVNLTVTVR